MANKVLAISIGSSNIKLVKINIKKDTIVLSNPIIVKTPISLVQNGRIPETGEFMDLLKEALSKMGRMVRKTVVLLNDNLIIARDMELPDAKPRELEQMVMMDAAGYLPSDISEYTIRFKVLLPSKSNPKKTNYIMMSSIKNDLVMDFYNIFRKMGLKPFAIDTSLNGMFKFFKFFLMSLYGAKAYLEKTCALLHIGASNAKLIIMQNGIPMFQQTMNHSSQMVDVLIANSLSLSEDEAEKYKIEYGISYLYSNTEDELCSKVGVVINSQLDILLSEVYGHIDDFNYKNPGKGVTNIWLSGGSANTKGLSRYITESFSIPCEVIQTNNLIKFSSAEMDSILQKEKLQEYFAFYSNLTGAAIRGD